jgi:hypothetical protein
MPKMHGITYRLARIVQDGAEVWVGQEHIGDVTRLYSHGVFYHAGWYGIDPKTKKYIGDYPNPKRYGAINDVIRVYQIRKKEGI